MLGRDEWEINYQKMIREKGLDRLNHQLYAGLLRYQDRTDEAILHCQIEVQRNPRSLVGHHTWAIVLSDKFRAEEAMQHYLAQLEISPNHPHSYNGVGTTLHDLRRHEDAIFFYQAQLFFNPRNKYSHLNLSLALGRLKRYPEAEHEHRAQLALHPTDRNTCDYYLELLNDMNQVKWPRSLLSFVLNFTVVVGSTRCGVFQGVGRKGALEKRLEISSRSSSCGMQAVS
jgi:tetratricopeptide (TPR) repeat protein